jgi:hypothetical protein
MDSNYQFSSYFGYNGNLGYVMLTTSKGEALAFSSYLLANSFSLQGQSLLLLLLQPHSYGVGIVVGPLSFLSQKLVDVESCIGIVDPIENSAAFIHMLIALLRCFKVLQADPAYMALTGLAMNVIAPVVLLYSHVALRALLNAQLL